MAQVIPLGRRVAEHPLAFRGGIELLACCLAAQDVWRACTRPQRVVLAGLWAELDASVQTGRTPVPLPALPDGVHPVVARGLAGRGLTQDGQLTHRGALVAWWAARPAEGAS